ncbi:probable terpene synthase 6 isoform X3 [Mangifera indica]|uniref:probable terpene synthase 6 isoform X3 n=1 Tax=Mangifera indica TaxID=29780 RepID=UPI001CFA6CB2|nr:probable terpene synthase 6 isoform X3 [Mangifera indica]
MAQQTILATNSQPRNQADYRPVANFAPSLWKDMNVFTTKLSHSDIESVERLVEELKGKVKKALVDCTNDLGEKVSYINAICRLGVSYHFENEIEDQLNQIFEAHSHFVEENDYDLNSVALLFQVLRQHGFKMSCGVFNKFKDNNNMFKESLTKNIRGMLNLYEASHFRLHGEDILEEALEFTRANLKFLADKSRPHLAKHILNALELPFHHGSPRMEARKFISFYEEDLEFRNETLLLFAKLDFNRVQLLHQQEIRHLMSWWNSLDMASKYPYSRDRVVELYTWSVSTFYEPCYSRARIIYSKCTLLLAIIDDTYDAYGTLEEHKLFTHAVQRWDVNAVDDLPDYMRPVYRAILELFDELDEDVKKEGRSYSVSMTKVALKHIVEAYLVESQWFREGFIPPFEERLSNGITTASWFFSTAAMFVGMGEIAGIKECEWLQKYPKVVEASYKICRLQADIVSHLV